MTKKRKKNVWKNWNEKLDNDIYVVLLLLLLMQRCCCIQYLLQYSFSSTSSSFGKMIEQRKFDWKTFFCAGCALLTLCIHILFLVSFLCVDVRCIIFAIVLSAISHSADLCIHSTATMMLNKLCRLCLTFQTEHTHECMYSHHQQLNVHIVNCDAIAKLC